MWIIQVFYRYFLMFKGYLKWEEFVKAMDAFAGKSLAQKIDLFIKVISLFIYLY